jgi:hypothetical protein
MIGFFSHSTQLERNGKDSLMRSGNEQHGVAMPRLLLLTGVILLLADYSFAQASPDPNPNAMPANKVGRSSIWIRRCQAARPRDLWT